MTGRSRFITRLQCCSLHSLTRVCVDFSNTVSYSQMEGVYLAAFLSVQLALVTAVVQTPSGPLQGIDGELVTKFFGVPYANKPERLEKATLVTPVSHLNHGYCQSCSVDVRNAIEKGPWCYQLAF